MIGPRRQVAIGMKIAVGESINSMRAKETSPCRLQVLLARNASVGVIFRRGPTKWVQLITWDTCKDTFKEGQWFHGHIYVGRSDLSPSGSFLIYFANKFNKRTLSDKEYTHAWTAISKPPFLAALALWPKGDCWHGGGLFTGEQDVFLNHRPEVATPHPEHRPRGVRVTPNPGAVGEDGPIVVSRMERDGWKFVQGQEYDYSKNRTVRPAVAEKRNGNGSLKLRVEKYDDPQEQWLCSVLDGKGAEALVGVGTWADFDQRGRLVFASEGKLFSGALTHGKVALTQLADFNDSKPIPRKAPLWATRW
jgi:hypothetical protein